MTVTHMCMLSAAAGWVFAVFCFWVSDWAIERQRMRDAVPLIVFDAVIDCLYEYDLGQELPPHWPVLVRRQIEAARKRIMQRRRDDVA